jgi:hypothetical protein
MKSGAMLGPEGNSFHPERGIGQGDTPSTLVFIAVSDILLTLLDSSSTGIAHAYADDLIHLSPSLDLQQRHADLVCGFCAFTGLEIATFSHCPRGNVGVPQPLPIMVALSTLSLLIKLELCHTTPSFCRIP